MIHFTSKENVNNPIHMSFVLFFCLGEKGHKVYTNKLFSPIFVLDLHWNVIITNYTLKINKLTNHHVKSQKKNEEHSHGASLL